MSTTSTSTTTTTTTTRDRGDRYGPIEWAQLEKIVDQNFDNVNVKNQHIYLLNEYERSSNSTVDRAHL